MVNIVGFLWCAGFCSSHTPRCLNPRPFVPPLNSITTRDLFFAFSYTPSKFIACFCGSWRLWGTRPDFTSFSHLSHQQHRPLANPEVLHLCSPSQQLYFAPTPSCTLSPASPGAPPLRSGLPREEGWPYILNMPQALSLFPLLMAPAGGALLH